ncbi:MAG: site-specific tyrosine recombinase/integron integrase [archaeon]
MSEEVNSDIMKKFRQELVISGYSDQTKKMYLLYTKKFLNYINKPALQAKRDDIVGFMAEMKESRNLSNSSLSLIHSSLKFFFHNFLKQKIVDDVRLPKQAKKLPTVLSVKEVKELIKATERGRNKLIVEFLYSSGVRVSECVNMKVVDLDLNECMARVKAGKGNKDRIIILSKKWVTELKKYLNKRKKVKTEWLFSKKNGKKLSADTIQRIVRNSKETAGIQKHVTVHSLRHSFATHLLESGENIRKIQELLGHSNLSTTQIYTKVSEQELKKVVSPLDRLKGIR